MTAILQTAPDSRANTLLQAIKIRTRNSSVARERERERASAIGDKAGESAMRQATYYSGKKFKNN
jgi:hypothetical protein